MDGTSSGWTICKRKVVGLIVAFGWTGPSSSVGPQLPDLLVRIQQQLKLAPASGYADQLRYRLPVRTGLPERTNCAFSSYSDQRFWTTDKLSQLWFAVQQQFSWLVPDERNFPVQPPLFNNSSVKLPHRCTLPDGLRCRYLRFSPDATPFPYSRTPVDQFNGPITVVGLLDSGIPVFPDPAPASYCDPRPHSPATSRLCLATRLVLALQATLPVTRAACPCGPVQVND